MQKIILFLLLTAIVLSCNNNNRDIQNLQNKINLLQSKIDSAYKPGFGEFMSSIQVHHEKLWFAGINQNWALADFEMGEIKEALDGIKEYCTDRPETASLKMITEPLENVNNAIAQKNLTQFKNNFTALTATCNSCHQETNHAFNTIKIPETPPFSNQDFKLQTGK
ncbi:MAG: hypothetical protein LBE82_03985 [Chitinophagaceae bacterium]|jgi:hypothetical protein|nr:hypothetical protein [Chitinophagaceae bacterium]